MAVSTPSRALELFCGIGGFAAAAADALEVQLAVDVDQRCLEIYRTHFPTHPTRAALVETLPPRLLANADLWWASPPCQPYTSRGRRRDLDDPRSAGMLALIELVETLRPASIAIENVPGFMGSGAHQRLRAILDRGGWEIEEVVLCPTELGIPNRRPRWYLVASRSGLAATTPEPPVQPRPLASFLDSADDPTLLVPAEVAARFRAAMRVVDRQDQHAVAPTFTSGYATSPVQAGGFLATPAGPRRFSPAEVLRLLGFPSSFSFPTGLSRQTCWRLAGNSLSIPAVRNRLARLGVRPPAWYTSHPCVHPSRPSCSPSR
jgi:DNA (cytosine-5)-methyltransferase 1